MKSLKEFNQDLMVKSEKHLGYDLSKEEQRSERWLKSRLGVITASKAISIVKEGRKKGTPSALWETYQMELIGEIFTGEAKATALTEAMRHGNAYEHEARELFSFEQSLHVDELTFCYRDDMRCGASPDGLVDGVGIIEVKCPFNTSNHLAFLLDDSEIKKEYIAQMQFQMWVLDVDLCYFVSYEPRTLHAQLKQVEIKRDPEMIADFEIKVPLFAAEMDEKLDKLGLKFGDQWA